MKGSKILIVGGLAVACLLAYEIYKHYHSNKGAHKSNTQDEDRVYPKQGDQPPVGFPATPDSDLYETKEAVVDSVKERHSEAAKVMEESLNTIFKESDEAPIASENSDTLDQTSSALNDLLK